MGVKILSDTKEAKGSVGGQQVTVTAVDDKGTDFHSTSVDVKDNNGVRQAYVSVREHNGKADVFVKDGVRPLTAEEVVAAGINVAQLEAIGRELSQRGGLKPEQIKAMDQIAVQATHYSTSAHPEVKRDVVKR